MIRLRRVGAASRRWIIGAVAWCALLTLAACESCGSCGKKKAQAPIREVPALAVQEPEPVVEPIPQEDLSVEEIMVREEARRKARERRRARMAEEADKELPAPPGPRLVSPRDGKKYRKAPNIISLKWRKYRKAVDYQLEVATWSTFDDVVADETTSGTSFGFRPPAYGTFYWRVRATLKDERETKFSKPYEFTVVAPQEAQRISKFGADEAELSETERFVVTEPDNQMVTDKAMVRVVGKAANKMKIFVNGKAVKTRGKGRFTTSHKLKMGINAIVVEAETPDGQRSFNTRYVVRKRTGQADVE